MDGNTAPIGQAAATVHLHVSYPVPIDMARVPNVFADVAWLGLRVDGATGRDDLRRVRTDLELPIRDSSATGPIRKAALLDIGTPQAARGGVEVEIGWQSASLAPLFPIFAGRLRLEPEGLTLDGEYVPPLGRLGLLIDEEVLGFIARRTADAFLARVGQRLRE